MADLVIRGMEMPTEQRIEVLIFKNGFVAYYDVEGRYIGQAKAVPLPEGHGRLIDADAIVKTICNSCDGQCEVVQCDCLNCKADCRCDIVKEISDAPTIVPAEGGEADGN